MRHDRLAQLHRDKARVVNPDDADRVLRVEETKEDGKATISFVVPEGHTGLGLKLDGGKAFPFLANARNADGYLLLGSPDGTWTAHLVESKKTRLRPTKLADALDQIDASVVRLQLLADFLGINIRSWTAWVAYLTDEVKPGAIPDPFEVRVPDRQSELSPREQWERGVTRPLQLVGAISLRGIQLDETGLATSPLASTA